MTHIIRIDDLDLDDLRIHLASCFGENINKRLYAKIKNDVAYYVVESKGSKKEYQYLEDAVKAYNEV